MKTAWKLSLAWFAASSGAYLCAATPSSPSAPAAFKQFCGGCHGKAATAGINLEQLLAAPLDNRNFGQWQKIAAVLEEKRMPPAAAPQPDATERSAAASWVRVNLKNFAEKHAGDPGGVN